MSQVITRFAPSPTGYLHIGGARTALFSWLFARRHGGQFRLRIEDTDRARSTEDAVNKIFEGLKWLGLDWDGDAVMQFSRAARHAEVARQLLAEGKAYRCYCSQEELAQMRETAKAEGRPMGYDGRWRDRDASEAPSGVPPVIRLKAPKDGETLVADLVQDEVKVANSQLDDMVLLRADGTPTYMLSVVVDDHDMNVTHVIRGDDHLTNTFRQMQIYNAMGWTAPSFGHIPLIHGPDGAKLSKRHGALGVEAYRDMGFLPEAMRNYLLRLGWSHGDDEIISTEQAVSWFNLENVGRSPARFDLTKLSSLNAHYLRQASDARLAMEVAPLIEKSLGRQLSPEEAERLTKGMEGLKERAKTLVELAESARFYAESPNLDAKALKAMQPLLDNDRALQMDAFLSKAYDLPSFDRAGIEALARNHSEETGMKLGDLAQPLRAALTGSTTSPPIFEVMEILGANLCQNRFVSAIKAVREAT
ncbi:Glutamate--tRNA ligase 2 [Rhodospirillaceae bacterium LM-1]|nr:Glutamate--tRNA ligase 2 [Rhodospirillaceae bacterium LM-1]